MRIKTGARMKERSIATLWRMVSEKRRVQNWQARVGFGGKGAGEECGRKEDERGEKVREVKEGGNGQQGKKSQGISCRGQDKKLGKRNRLGEERNDKGREKYLGMKAYHNVN